MDDKIKTLQQKIDEACVAVGMSRIKLSKMLGTTQSSFNNSVNSGKFKQSRLSAIAEKLGAEYYAHFVYDDGRKFDIAGMDSILDVVKTICEQEGVKLVDTAKRLGYKGSYNFSARLTTGLFSQEELENIANALDCKYECGFVLGENSAQIALDNYNSAESDEVLTEEEKAKREEARLRKNARQREYAKRTGYSSNYNYVKNNTKTYTFKFVINTDADIIEQLEKQDNKAGYIKRLIREDIEKNKLINNKE